MPGHSSVPVSCPAGIVSTRATVPSCVVHVAVTGNEDASGTLTDVRSYARYAASDTHTWFTTASNRFTVCDVVQSAAAAQLPPGVVGAATLTIGMEPSVPPAAGATVTVKDTDAVGVSPVDGSRWGTFHVIVEPLWDNDGSSVPVTVTFAGSVSTAIAPSTGACVDWLVAVSV